MPELPEVETVMRGMAPVMEGRVVKEAKAWVPKLRVDIDPAFEQKLSGTRLVRMYRRSKYIVMDFAGGLSAILHLGMSGRISIHASTEAQPDRQKHDHVTFLTDRGDFIVFNDARRFGLIVLCSTEDIDTHPLIRDIGPEPLGNQFDVEVLKRGLKNRKSPIKTALLDQKLVAGLGNIYVCETLWRAGVRPTRRSDKVTQKETEQLVPIIRDVLTEAIAAGGSTLKDYAQVSGELGYFQHRFSTYGREGEACLSEGCGASIQRIVQSNRSSFYCPKCQK